MNANRDEQFAIAVAVTTDHALMACGFLSQLRHFHPTVDLFIFTDCETETLAHRIAKAFGARPPITTDDMGFSCEEWGPIVTAKFRVFSLPTERPVMFLDIDQIITKPLTPFVDRFLASGLFVAGGSDDEPMGNQFKAGCTPSWISPHEEKILNTGAFIARPRADLAALIERSIPEYRGIVRLPTQALINGILHRYSIPFDLYGDDFMIGPFNPRILDVPASATLLHLWTPRPPFMAPNPVRPGIDGSLTWRACVEAFEATTGQEYPTIWLRNAYMNQMEMFETRYAAVIPGVDRAPLHVHHYTISSVDREREVESASNQFSDSRRQGP